MAKRRWRAESRGGNLRCEVLRRRVFAMSSDGARVWAVVGDEEKERVACGKLGRKRLGELWRKAEETAGACRS